MKDFIPYDECPVCSDPIDYCQGHGEIGDEHGYKMLQEYLEEYE